ncbi:Uncharacterized transporter AF_0788 [Linum perenne]
MVHDFLLINPDIQFVSAPTLSPMAAAAAPYLTPQPWRTTTASDINLHGRRNGAVSTSGGCLFTSTRRRRRSNHLKFIITLSADDPSPTSGRNAPIRSVNGERISGEKKKRPLWKKILFSSKKLRSVMLLNVVAVVYASDFSVVKAVETTTDPAAFATVRFIVSAVPFLPFVVRSRGDIRTRNAGLELGLWASLGYLIEAVSLLTADAGRASFISLFTVIVVPLLDGMLGATVPARTWFGVLMSVLGVAMLESSGSPPNAGDLLSFLSAIFFGIHMLRTEHFSRKTEKEDFLTLLGYEMAAMRNVSATETAVIYGLEPVYGAGFAWLLLGERWGIAGWIGAAFVLGGSLMVQVVGDATSSESIKNKSKEKKPAGLVLISEKQRNLTAATVVVRSSKDVTDRLK